MLSTILTCCKNCQILICSNLKTKTKSLHLLFKFVAISFRSRLWIALGPTENDSTRLYKDGDISAVIRCR